MTKERVRRWLVYRLADFVGVLFGSILLVFVLPYAKDFTLGRSIIELSKLMAGIYMAGYVIALYLPLILIRAIFYKKNSSLEYRFTYEIWVLVFYYVVPLIVSCVNNVGPRYFDGLLIAYGPALLLNMAVFIWYEKEHLTEIIRQKGFFLKWKINRLGELVIALMLFGLYYIAYPELGMDMERIHYPLIVFGGYLSILYFPNILNIIIVNSNYENMTIKEKLNVDIRDFLLFSATIILALSVSKHSILNNGLFWLIFVFYIMGKSALFIWLEKKIS